MGLCLSYTASLICFRGLAKSKKDSTQGGGDTSTDNTAEPGSAHSTKTAEALAPGLVATTVQTAVSACKKAIPKQKTVQVNITHLDASQTEVLEGPISGMDTILGQEAEVAMGTLSGGVRRIILLPKQPRQLQLADLSLSL